VESRRDRIRKCLRGETTSVTPWQINCTSALADRMIALLGLKGPRCDVLGINVYRYEPLERYFGNHILYLRNRAVDSVREVDTGIWRDEWGVLWDRRIDRDIGVPVNRLLDTAGALDRLRVPDPGDPDRYAHFDPLLRVRGDRYALVKFSYSLFERAWSLRGMEELMVDIVEDPGFVRELLDRLCEFNLAVLEELKRFPVDGVYFADDWGCQRGLLFSPSAWRTLIKPFSAKLFAKAHAQGYDVFIHCCGDVSSLLDDLVEMGLNAFNPFQPEVMDVEALMARYQGRLAFYGGLSVQRTLPLGTPRDVTDEVQHRLGLARRHGGLIASPSHDMPPDVPVENVLALTRALQSQEPDAG
jgi:uroporphyrinogen decarboxylase